MARVTVEDCLKKIDNRFVLTVAAAITIRSGFLNRLMQQGGPESKTTNKVAVSALRAIASGAVGSEMLLKIPL